MGEFVTLDVQDGVGLIRLDRPPANALSRAVNGELGEAFAEADSRRDVGAIVIWGGPKIFAAGADIKEMAEDGPEDIRGRVGLLTRALDVLERSPKVSIAAMSGLALGGGFEVALACDLRYLAEDGAVGQPEIKLGVIPGAGGTQRLTRMVGPGMARWLVYTGTQLGAEAALRLGLVERVFPAAELLEAAMREARAFAHGPREALAAAKAAIRAAVDTPGREGFEVELDRFAALFGTADQREGMLAFREKRAPIFGAE